MGQFGILFIGKKCLLRYDGEITPEYYKGWIRLHRSRCCGPHCVVRRYRAESKPEKEDTFTMCGKMCAVRNINKILRGKDVDIMD